MDKINLLDGERLDDLELNNLMIIQHKDKYCFTSDSVLLSAFAHIKRGETAADLGTGSGIIAILLAAKTSLKHIYGIEIQPYMADMAKRSVEYNGLTERVTICNTPMQEAHKTLGYHTLDAVVCNPPYRRPDSGARQQDEEILISRHETAVTLGEVIESAARLLKYGGRMYMIHQAERLADIICGMRANNLEPKRLRYIIDKEGMLPKRILIEAHSYGKNGLITESNLVIFNKDGEYTDEVKRIYNKK